jgi:predicted glycosyl hydrolase (DUF1957 family)
MWSEWKAEERLGYQQLVDEKLRIEVELHDTRWWQFMRRSELRDALSRTQRHLRITAQIADQLARDRVAIEIVKGMRDADR